jgi:hypothetical protein
MKKTLLFILIMATVGITPVLAQDASTAWRKILQKCAKTDLIKNQYIFFGVSNTIGPGSVWRFAEDKSIRLMFELADAFPDTAQQEKLVHLNNVAACTGNSTTGWNLKLTLPFTTGATPLSLDISAVLGQAKKVTVSISGYSVDVLKETDWKEGFQSLGKDNAYSKEILQPNRVIAENVVKVKGFKATFDYKTDLSADVKAKYKGVTFTLGNSSTTPGKQTLATDTKQIEDTAQSVTSTVKEATSKKPSKNKPADKGGCSLPADPSSDKATGASATPKPTAGTGNSNSGSPGTGLATLHVDFTSNRQIVICADGPFYLLAAYSKLVNGAPIGLTATSADLSLRSVEAPPNAPVESDRKPQ